MSGLCAGEAAGEGAAAAAGGAGGGVGGGASGAHSGQCSVTSKCPANVTRRSSDGDASKSASHSSNGDPNTSSCVNRNLGNVCAPTCRSVTSSAELTQPAMLHDFYSFKGACL